MGNRRPEVGGWESRRAGGQGAFVRTGWSGDCAAWRRGFLAALPCLTPGCVPAQPLFPESGQRGVSLYTHRQLHFLAALMVAAMAVVCFQCWERAMANLLVLYHRDLLVCSKWALNEFDVVRYECMGGVGALLPLSPWEEWRLSFLALCLVFAVTVPSGARACGGWFAGTAGWWNPKVSAAPLGGGFPGGRGCRPAVLERRGVASVGPRLPIQEDARETHFPVCRIHADAQPGLEIRCGSRTFGPAGGMVATRAEIWPLSDSEENPDGVGTDGGRAGVASGVVVFQSPHKAQSNTTWNPDQ